MNARISDLAHFMSDVPSNDEPLPLMDITDDKDKNKLPQHLKDIVNHNARCLSAFGFIQQPSRPTLFRYQSTHWNVFADLDSTKVLSIWETNGTPALYAFPRARGRDERRCRPDCRECVLETAEHKLKQAGIETRRHFMDERRHSHEIVLPERSECVWCYYIQCVHCIEAEKPCGRNMPGCTLA